MALAPTLRQRMQHSLLLVVAAGAGLALAPCAQGYPAMGTHSDQIGTDDGVSKPDYYRYVDRAYPAKGISPAQSAAARAAFAAIQKNAQPAGAAWSQLTYSKASVPGAVTYTGLPFTAAGRTTALALTPGCSVAGQANCRALMGAAGGGIWITNNPFGTNPVWTLSSTGLLSNAIGSIAVDPNANGQVIYVGTGEQNSSGDSEAGVGLFKSTDGGQTWSVLPASVPLASGQSVSSIVVDPRDSMHLYFGTATALHGAAASAGAYVPPGTAPAGLYESHDGGVTFSQIYSNGPGSFTGSVMQVGLDPSDLDTVYAAVLGIGLIRQSAKLDGDTAFHLVYATRSPTGARNDGFNRQAFALAKTTTSTRVYVGDSIDSSGESFLVRTDNARVPAATLTDGVNNAGWLMLSSPTPGTPGYASYGFCEGQCFYDIWVASPAGHPDDVWFGGSMNYNEIFTAHPPSNGRAVMRSSDAGVSFTDMTRDARVPYSAGMHPDQHAVLFNPLNRFQVIAASDGGLVRTSGAFTDASAQCATRGLSATDLADCQGWLKAIPTTILPINQGLETLQFQDVEYDPFNPNGAYLGGTQDNGTWAALAGSPFLIESVGGDGGLSGYDAARKGVNFHTYYGPQVDVNFSQLNTLGWDWIADPLVGSNEQTEFYMAAISDPIVGGTMFAGLQHVFRTTDNGGAAAYLQQHCNELTGDFAVTCGDWVPLGADLTGPAFGKQRAGGTIAILTRWTGDHGTLWAATSKGRVFMTTNADAADPTSVVFNRVNDAMTPQRVVSGIALDLADNLHAYIAYTGYSENTPTIPGHVFDVHVKPGAGATFTDISYNLGDLPVTSLVRDATTGALYAGTDFGVLELAAGSTTWVQAGTGLPYTAVYQLKLAPTGLMYAATHGRGIWTLQVH